MPTALASGTTQIFAYRANITMPREMTEWETMISCLVRHLIDRYTLAEVRTWFFEVWNEPDIEDFWANSYHDYLALYQCTSRAIKEIDSQLRVGGPAGSSVIFQTQRPLEDFLDDVVANQLPLDFISVHPYPTEFLKPEGRSRQLEHMLNTQQMCKWVQWSRNRADQRGLGGIPLHLNEWNSSPRFTDYVHDTAFMATFVIENALALSNYTDMLGWWTVSDLFDEGGVVTEEFGGGFGLINRSGIKKPAFFGTWALSRLSERCYSVGDGYIVTGGDSCLQVLLWNHVFYTRAYASGDKSTLGYSDRYGAFESAPSKSYRIFLPGFEGQSIQLTRSVFDRDHGSAYDDWLRNGAVEHMTEEETQILLDKTHLLTENRFMRDGAGLVLEETVPPFGFVLYEIKTISQK